MCAGVICELLLKVCISYVQIQLFFNFQMTCFSRSVVLSLCFDAGTTTEYKDECIVDKDKKPTEDGNYKDCTGEDHVADGSTDCCNVDGVIDCCDKNASYA